MCYYEGLPITLRSITFGHSRRIVRSCRQASKPLPVVDSPIANGI